MNSWPHRFLAYWLLIHAAFTAQTLIIRNTTLLEWSILLLIGYVLLLFLLVHRGRPRELKRLNWLMVPYSLLSLGSTTYGVYCAFLVWQIKPDLYKPELHVPVGDPIYVISMVFSTLSAVALALFLSKYSRARTAPSPSPAESA